MAKTLVIAIQRCKGCFKVLIISYLFHFAASSSNLSEHQSDVTSTTLALKTLGSFDFEGHSLTQFVRHCADHFLSSEYKEIRMEAVKTCAKLLMPLLNVSIGSSQSTVIAHWTAGQKVEQLI